MHPDPAIHEILCKFSDSLCKQQKAIVDEWLKRVIADAKIPASDQLTHHQIEDHIPVLLQELAALIAAPGNPVGEASAEAAAESHGACRWQQGYDLAALLREFAQFRAVVLRHLFTFEANEPTFSAAAKLLAVDKLHLLVDGLISTSIQEFVSEQEARMRQHALAVVEESDARLRLLRTVSHEVRNVLNAVSMAAQSLPEETDDAMREETTAIVLRNVRHMRELLDQLLEVSALIAERKASPASRFNPAALVQEIAATYGPMAAGKGLTLQSVADPELAFIESDALKVRQIACNLVSNALKYTDEGWVRLELRAVDDECFAIVVEDSGVGMTPAEAERIFSEFYRIQRTAHQPGVGLGLAITKQLVGVLGGKIDVRSELSRGSRFEVVLARVHREGAGAAQG